MGNWIVEFKGRNNSSRINQNFLWQEDFVYIMDNHRAALWCWLQQISNKEKYGIFHIDQHYDAGPNNLSKSNISPNDLWKISIDDYLNLSYKAELNNNQMMHTIHYGNYLSILFENFAHLFSSKYFITQDQGAKPNLEIAEPKLYHLLGNFNYWLENENSWVLNLDLDIFFTPKEDGHNFKFIDDDFIMEFAKEINHSIQSNKIKVLTIALSPEFCKSWKHSEKVLDIFTNKLNLNFKLP